MPPPPPPPRASAAGAAKVSAATAAEAARMRNLLLNVPIWTSDRTAPPRAPATRKRAGAHLRRPRALHYSQIEDEPQMNEASAGRGITVRRARFRFGGEFGALARRSVRHQLGQQVMRGVRHLVHRP